MNVVPLLSLLLFTFGVFTFGGLSVLWLQGALGRRGRRSGRSDPVGRINLVEGANSFTTFVWFVLNLVYTLSSLGPAFGRNGLSLALFANAFLFPPLLFHVFSRPAGRLGDRPVAWRVVLRALYVLGPAMAVAVSVAGYQIVRLPVDEQGPHSAFLDAAGVLLGILMIVAMSSNIGPFATSRLRSEGTKERSLRVGMQGMLGIVIVLMGLVILWNLRLVEFGELFRTVVYSMPLLMFFFQLFFTDRYAFFDLFVKRGLSLLAAILLLTLYFSLVLPVLGRFDFAWAEPWVYAIAVLPVAVVLPSLYRRVGAWVDRVWLGRRFTTVEAVKQFLASMQSATTERQLVDRAEQGISLIFRAPTRIDLASGGSLPAEFQSKLDVPIHGGHGRVGVMHLGPRAAGAPFFSEDRSLLNSLAEVFAHMLENTRLQERGQAQERRAKELSLQASRSDLKALRAQINPHFLFNALNAIAGLIHKDPGRADRTVEQLAEVFRYTLRRSEREWAPLEDEFEFVRAYLEVEQARFGERLQCRVTLDDAVASTFVPTMMVQTLVENAVKHGVAAVRGRGQVEVDARPDGNQLRIEVADNGPGLSDARPSTQANDSGYGLKNIRERLRGYFEDRAELVLRRDEGRQMTLAGIVMPLTTDAPGPRAAEREPVEGAGTRP